MSVPPPSLPPRYRAQPLRVACVQYDVKMGRVAENAAKVEAMTAGLAPGALDLLVLPEMALSGYMFATPAAIAPYLETPGGPTARLATALASRLKCYVVAGYPEAIPGADIDLGVGYNSAVLAGPEGVIGNYRKTFRFDTDKTWAREGDGFAFFDLPQPLGRVGVGICMDLNPRDFIAPWNAYELATFAVDNAVDMLVVPMNWLDPAEQDDSDSDEDDGLAVPPRDPNAPSESNLNYWAARLAPLHDPTPRYDEGTPAAGREVVFVAANRVGTEEGTTFAGTSCVMAISSVPSRIELIEVCSRSEERVLVAEIA
ncbi:carbon-nitrogen hydrolase [Cutaneotrichosporon oleaginosum]|uniref:Carbon-nitrogen hydrolase n=1 Tax=Cutaneotrichosporon oleaginosum TaxID=879819 RepID=A0A0J0XM78_9TREE|nr:carbon-nitrogen hydrolase [Cutaneotrichosporon oleaginosum]KLT42163.1 carbon-nitrogen hydrolase [Cutaneotrichosporon oleaginosum]TXT11714.1 hypothetical protein COLE_02124 [Cutaneotrichosporon oleaginosum]